jgi:hypothetical protein
MDNLSKYDAVNIVSTNARLKMSQPLTTGGSGSETRENKPGTRCGVVEQRGVSRIEIRR